MNWVLSLVATVHVCAIPVEIGAQPACHDEVGRGEMTFYGPVAKQSCEAGLRSAKREILAMRGVVLNEVACKPESGR